MATDGDPLVAIQNAALERALLAETDSSEYVLLAGALERARPDDAEAESTVSSVLSGDDTDAEIDADRIAGSLLTATLTATFAVRHGLGAGGPARLPSPSVVAESAGAGSVDGDRRRRLLLEGALLAVERFDATTAEAADLAEVGVSAFERQVERRS
ncbi:hypothetical protein [Salinirubrum litoreum]|uniref:Uncharacterized protein n=1 Tax=Salinirubrum litoreum TaxID=1126234 RepID=A0ABD5R731_9EURY|nr:hypothetical protein [Salinirubrum litoreum]